ncbi:MAG TPA: glycosyltransferase family 2 protein, partial [Rudaea sp.]
DEDKLDENGEHVEVHCKPDFSPDYFFSLNYLCHFSVLRRSLLESIGGFRAGFDGAQDYDLFLRASERTERIAHIPLVLYHWRKISGSTATTSQAKPTTTLAGQRALAESMQRRNIDCDVEAGPFPNSFRVRRRILGDPLVSILIPFRDKAALLDACVTSVLEKTRYRNFEIVCIDNGSTEEETRRTLERLQRADRRVAVERFDAPFNYSAINNYGVRRSKGEHLLFLNNDTEVIASEWLDSMLEHSQRPEVGVVGARLLYGDDTIQHAGVIVGPGGVAGHAHLFSPGDDPGYFSRIRLVQNLSAVTFACAMTRRAVFEQVGGLNADDLKIAFNDVDYCLRVREAGYLIVYTPYALLHHYESKSRGYEDTPEKQARFSTEVLYMQKRFKSLIERGDPYYNPRLSLSNSFQPDPNYVYELPR